MIHKNKLIIVQHETSETEKKYTPLLTVIVSCLFLENRFEACYDHLKRYKFFHEYITKLLIMNKTIDVFL
eukprot:UN13509